MLEFICKRVLHLGQCNEIPEPDTNDTERQQTADGNQEHTTHPDSPSRFALLPRFIQPPRAENHSSTTAPCSVSFATQTNPTIRTLRNQATVAIISSESPFCEEGVRTETA